MRNLRGNVIDRGFINIGVRPTSDDLGAGATDVFGQLSFTRRLFPDAPPSNFDGAAVTLGFGVQGAFKIPSLRNVALTAPYFHNGDAMTLRQVVELYSRGGNVAPITNLDGTTIDFYEHGVKTFLTSMREVALLPEAPARAGGARKAPRAKKAPKS